MKTKYDFITEFVTITLAGVVVVSILGILTSPAFIQSMVNVLQLIPMY